MTTRRNSSRRKPPAGRPAGGFTLVEMITAILILAVLVSLAVPSFREATLSSKLTAFANDVVAGAQLARSEAIKRNVTVTVCASSDGESCDDPAGWEVGWIVVADLGGTSEALIQHRPALPQEFRMSQDGGVASVLFPPTVVADNEVTLTVCRAVPEGSQERVVTITAARNARVSTPDPSVGCAD